MEIDWVKMDGEPGTLILLSDGIYFQTYKNYDKPPYLLGHALAINQTGVFGAINMEKKISDDGIPSHSEMAKELRKKVGLERLIEEKKILYFSWEKIKEIKKSILFGTTKIVTARGNKIKVSHPNDRVKVFDYIYQYVNTRELPL